MVWHDNGTKKKKKKNPLPEQWQIDKQWQLLGKLEEMTVSQVQLRIQEINGEVEMTGVQSDASLESDGSAPASDSEAADAVIHQQEHQGLLCPCQECIYTQSDC